MHTDVRASFERGLKIALILSLLLCMAASCRPKHAMTVSRPHCAFADPEFTTSLGICLIAAESYIANHEWPSDLRDLQEQWKRMLSQGGAKGQQEFFDCLTLVELRKKDSNLVLHYRFKLDKKTVDQRVTLKPGATADEILEAATGGN